MGSQRVGHDWATELNWFIERIDGVADAPILWHLTQRANLLEKTLIPEKIESKRRRGWQMIRYLYGIINSMDMSLSKVQERVKDRKAWCAVVHGVTEIWTWLSNWTSRGFKNCSDICSWQTTELEHRFLCIRIQPTFFHLSSLWWHFTSCFKYTTSRYALDIGRLEGINTGSGYMPRETGIINPGQL